MLSNDVMLFTFSASYAALCFFPFEVENLVSFTLSCNVAFIAVPLLDLARSSLKKLFYLCIFNNHWFCLSRSKISVLCRNEIRLRSANLKIYREENWSNIQEEIKKFPVAFV